MNSWKVSLLYWICLVVVRRVERILDGGSHPGTECGVGPSPMMARQPCGALFGAPVLLLGWIHLAAASMTVDVSSIFRSRSRASIRTRP